MSAHPVRGGIWGKVPSRGDFVRIGLGRGFTDAWDAWFSAMLVDSRAALGDAWQAAWLVAPVWRFCLRAGLCGPDTMLGVWMPSVDNAGRNYPLTLAVCVPGPVEHDGGAADWLDSAEDAGIAALEQGLSPIDVVERLGSLGACTEWREASASAWTKERRGVWGGRHASPSALLLPSMPSHVDFVGMLQ